MLAQLNTERKLFDAGAGDSALALLHTLTRYNTSKLHSGQFQKEEVQKTMKDVATNVDFSRALYHKIWDYAGKPDIKEFGRLVAHIEPFDGKIYVVPIRLFRDALIHTIVAERIQQSDSGLIGRICRELIIDRTQEAIATATEASRNRKNPDTLVTQDAIALAKQSVRLGNTYHSPIVSLVDTIVQCDSNAITYYLKVAQNPHFAPFTKHDCIQGNRWQAIDLKQSDA